MSLSWLVGVEVPDVTEFWFYNLHIGAIKLHSLTFWKLVPHVYGLVFTQRRPLGSAGLFLDFLMIASLALICFTFWVSILFLRLLLYYLNYLSTTTLLDWPTRMVCSLLLVHVKNFLIIIIGSLLLWFNLL